MIDLSGELTAAERVVLAVDTSDQYQAKRLAYLAHDAGALIIKQGLEIITAEDIAFCSQNAANAGLSWVADAKLDDIPTTVAKAVKNIVSADFPPSAITVHAHSGIDAMKAAQDVAGEAGVLLFAVTELTSQKPERLKQSLEFVLNDLGIEYKDLDKDAVRRSFVYMRAVEAHYAGIGGLVASAMELDDPIMSDGRLKSKITLIPGTRSKGKDAHDQQNVITPEEAIEKGATLLVIGRQVTESEQPEQEMAKVTAEIQSGLDKRRVA